MGRAARNSGGTGGHGYFPLPGEKPNYNRHIMTDRALFGLVKDNERKPPLSGGLKVVQEEKMKDMSREKDISTNNLFGYKMSKKNTTKSASKILDSKVNCDNLLTDKNFKSQDKCLSKSTNMNKSKKEPSEKKRCTTLPKNSSANKLTSPASIQPAFDCTRENEKQKTPKIQNFEQAENIQSPAIQQVL